MKKALLIFICFFFAHFGFSQQTTKREMRAIDLKPFCPTPGNQDGVNACVGYAIGYGAMTVLRAIDMNQKNQDSVNQNCFSPYFLFNQTLVDSFDCDKGASYSKSIELLKSQGNCFVQDFNVVKDCYVQPDSIARKKASQYKILSGGMIFDRRHSTEQKIQTIKSFLEDSIPVVLNFEVYESFTQIESGTISWSKKDDDSYKAHHGLLVIGYDSTHFEIMNSWGVDWAQGGFAKMTYEDLVVNSLRAFAISFDSISNKRFLSPSENNIDKAVSSKGILSPRFQYPAENINKISAKIKGKIALSQTIATSDGGILNVGSITNRKNTQLLVQKISSIGAKSFKHISELNEWEDEYGVGVLELADSNFIAGGYSIPKDKLQASTVWINYHDSSGKRIKRKILKKSFLPLALESIQKNNGQIIFLGTENQNLWMIITDLKGNVLSKNKQFRKESNDYLFQSARLLLQDDAFFVFGTALVLGGRESLLPSDDDYKVPYLLKLDTNGALVEEILFLDLKVEKTGNITRGNNDQLIMVGTMDKSEKGKYFFLRISKHLDKSGMVLSKNGHAGFNEAVDLIALDNEEILVLGNTTGCEKGGRTFNIFLSKLDQYGKTKWDKPWYFGGKYEEQATQIIEKKNKSIWISAIHTNGKQKSNLLSLCVKEPVSNKRLVQDLEKITITSLTQNKCIQLYSEDQHDLVYELINEGIKDVTDLRMESLCLDCPSQFDFISNKINDPIRSGQNQQLILQVKVKRKSESGFNKVQVRFFNQANQLVFSEVIRVDVVNLRDKPFALSSARISSLNGGAFRPQEEAVLTVFLKNRSDRTYRSVKLKFELPVDVTINEPTSFSIDTWEASEMKIFKIKLTAGKDVKPRFFELNAFLRYGKNNIFSFAIQPALDGI